MDKIYKSFVCNSLCRIGQSRLGRAKAERKTFYPGNKVYLLNEFPDAMFNYLTVILAFGNWQACLPAGRGLLLKVISKNISIT